MMDPLRLRLPIAAAATLMVALAAPPAFSDDAPGRSAGAEASVQTKESQAAMTPTRAVEHLKAGNERFAAGELTSRDLLKEARETAKGQYPHAVILTCQDSRTSPEYMFDLGQGDAFGLRIAGNFVDEEILGGIEFGTKVAGAKVVAVIGHTECGAVKGAIDDAQLGNLTLLLARIKPAVEQVDAAVGPRTSSNKKFVQMVAEQNVRNAMRDIREKSSVMRELIDSGKVVVVGGMYNLETGRVDFYPAA